MIDIETLYITVNNDLARKDHAGYTSTDEFNRITNLIQGVLCDFYIEKNDARAKEPLRHLITEVKIQGSEYYDLPDNYRQKLEVYLESISSSCENGVVFTNVNADHLDVDEWGLNMESVIRKNQPAFGFIGNKIKVRPSTFIGRVYLKYYRNPTDASRAYTLNLTTKEEEYNAGSSVHLEWPASELTNFVDLHLLYKGISIRNTELVQFAMGKQQMNLKTAMNNE